MEKRYRVTLLEEERQGPAELDPEIADALGCGRATIGRG